MTRTEVATMIASIGIPYAYYQFERGTATEPPFLCFYYLRDNDVLADNTNYQALDHLMVELYTATKDFGLEKTVKDTLNENGLVYTWEETYIDTQRMYMTIFEADVVITEET